MNSEEIYNTLLAGKTLRIPFPDKASALSFRSSFFNFKKSKDQILVVMEVFVKPPMLSLVISPDNVVTVKFRERKAREYEVLIVEEDTSK
jgi:hypothetical protein